MSTQTLDQIHAKITASVAGAKALAAARLAAAPAPAGLKMPHGQHYNAQVRGEIAAASFTALAAAGQSLLSCSKPNAKTGKTTFTVGTPIALESRVLSYTNARARRNAKRAADKTAKEAAAPVASVTDIATAVAAMLRNVA